MAEGDPVIEFKGVGYRYGDCFPNGNVVCRPMPGSKDILVVTAGRVVLTGDQAARAAKHGWKFFCNEGDLVVVER